MQKIALTGPSGAGKGYVSEILRKYDLPTLDTDAVVHALYADAAFARNLQARFDSPVLAPDGSVDRKALGALVFSDENAMKKLQKLVYPLVREKIAEYIAVCAEKGSPAVFVDAPQLFEAGFEGDFDRILCVYAPKADRLRRIMRRDGISRVSAGLRMRSQMSGAEYKRRAHSVIDSRTGADVEKQTLDLLKAWKIL